jgi:CheY-like chemotaxis protein
MDHMMPEMDGIETTNEIKKLGGKYSGLVIIALTANAIYGAKEMFLNHGFNGYISKPIEMRDLKKTLIEWLPQEKVALIEQPLGEKEQTDSEIKFFRTLKRLFVKSNRDKFTEIVTALSTNDVERAHRLAHTLKGSAGQIGKKHLQSAAADVERYLAYGKNHVSEEQLKALETELNKVLGEFSSLYTESSHETVRDGESLSTQAVVDLLDKLEPLLKSGNPECLELVGELRLIPAARQLVQEIEDFEFENASYILTELKKLV